MLAGKLTGVERQICGLSRIVNTLCWSRILIQAQQKQPLGCSEGGADHEHSTVLFRNFSVYIKLELMNTVLRPQTLFICALLALPVPGIASKCFDAVDIFFPHGVASLTADQKERVMRTIERVEQNSAVLAIISIGHADLSDSLNKARAQDLSLRRALAVTAMISRIRPELTKLTYSEGKGIQQPVVATGDERNRRVEVEIVCPAS